MVTLGLKFRLDEVFEEPRPFEGTIPASEIDEVIGGMLGDLGYRAQGPAEVEGTVYRARRDVIVEARIRVGIGYDCVRCLDGLGLALDRLVHHVIVPGAGSEGATELEIDEGLEDEPEVDHYEGDQIDLVPLVREDILLELPMNPTCVDARGARCEKFDAVLGEQAGGEAEVDPRWAPLLEIKKKLN